MKRSFTLKVASAQAAAVKGFCERDAISVAKVASEIEQNQPALELSVTPPPN
ncbi:MAG TPA: hypothetical protein VF544_10345 [Pyrinomonadaceae bacterium]|jgi:hypothetical protein